ncbi:uncharacterized protein QC761_100460 [Podospora bellae-mahoneyi]|uniref:Uncharacterized protein n=1 Tax=Podospora bellae-mahoneyi TaxID=2093777 RepID=A0ABR0FTW1_9PEZI|nr:hypothetical protein QC761_100460 [Podospora bellae-mahoneyi]
MSTNAADPVVGVADSNMSFFRKHTPFGSLSGGRPPLNNIAITPFLQTLFTIPTVVSPSPQTAGLVLDGDDKTDPTSPVETSPETPASSVPSDTGAADKQPSPTVAVFTPLSALVPDNAWLDESLNAPVSPDSILALPNTLTGVGAAVVELPAPVEPCDGFPTATVAAVAAAAPASPTVKLLSVDPKWMDDALAAPVTPAALLALPQRTLILQVDALEESPVAPVAPVENQEAVAATEEKDAESNAPVAIPTPVPEQPTVVLDQLAAESTLAPVVLIADKTWMDEAFNSPVTPCALLALPEKNVSAADSSVPPPTLPVEEVQIAVPFLKAFNAPVTPLALLALPEKNRNSRPCPRQPRRHKQAPREAPDLVHVQGGKLDAGSARS